LRVKLSNRYGTRPLVIEAARVAVRSAGAGIDVATDRPLLVPAAIDAGQTAWSQPVDLALPGPVDLAVSLYLKAPVEVATVHLLAMQTSFLAPGNQIGAAALQGAIPLTSWPAVVGVDVADAEGAAIMAIGPSHIDGDGIAPDSRQRFGDQLAARLRAAGRPTAVLNYGIVGNRLLYDAPVDRRNPVGAALGQAALQRFERELLDASGARAVILCSSINDLGLPGVWAPTRELPRVDAMVAGYLRMAAEARARGMRVLVSNLAPFEQADIAPGYWSPHKEALRLAFNRSLAQNAANFDALLDFDVATRDVRHPSRLRKALDSGDHLHPNAQGYAELAAQVPLSLL
jgi:lysophospholipase L1-like esterase